MSAPVFISYSSKDQKIAGTIAQALEARGQKCWIASRDVRAGDNFQEAIVRALREAKVMLLVFSANANNSDEIKKELVLAGRHRVTVVPVRVEDVVPNDAFSYELATRQWVDLFQDWETQIEQLVAQVEMILAAPGETPPPPRPIMAPVPQKKSSSNALLAALVLLALLLGGGALAWFQPWAHSASTPATVAPAATQTAAATPAPVQAAPNQTPASPVAASQSAMAAAPAAKSTSEDSARKRQETDQKTARKADRQMAMAAAPAIAPAAAPVAAPAPAPAPAPVAAAPADPDEAAWQSASRTATRDSYNEYVRNFSGGLHLQEAQLALANMILTTPATGSAFDGSWQTTWTCANLGQYPGYSYRYEGTVRNGVYHGSRGEKGQPSSMVLDGRIDSDGIAAFFGEVVVGSSMTGLGVSRGTPSDFHALAHFDGGSGNGKRLEGRGCTLSFAKG